MLYESRFWFVVNDGRGHSSYRAVQSSATHENVGKKESKNIELFATRGDTLQLQSTLNEQLLAQNEIMKSE